MTEEERLANEANWTRVVSEWRSSGMAVSLFCEKRGLSASALGYWARRLERKTGAGAGIRMARVVRSREDSASESAVVIELGGARIEVRAGFNRSTLGAVLEVLGDRESSR